MHIYNKGVLALGSNLGDKKQHLQNAINEINNNLGIVVQASAIYQTPAWGFNSYPFYNMCILIHTHYSAEFLLFELQKIEKTLGRTIKASQNYEARTIDIDIIYYNNEIVDKPELKVPHAAIQNRKFVLVPLNDLIFEWKHPVLQKTTQELLLVCEDESEIKKVDSVVLPKDSFTFKNIHFLAIEGNIGAGKTTLAQKIACDFNGKTILERFADNPFLPKFYTNTERYAFPLELSFLADRNSQLKEQLDLFSKLNEVLITDYYIYKSLIFAQVTLDKDEFSLYKTFFDIISQEAQKPDLYVFLNQKTKNLLQNIKNRGREYEKNIQTNYLEGITQSYNKFIKTLPEENVLVIDVTDKNFVNNHKDYLYVLHEINNKIAVM